MPFFGELKQGPPSNELHGEVGLWTEAAVGGPRFVDLSNPGMLQAAERVGFLPSLSSCMTVKGPSINSRNYSLMTGTSESSSALANRCVTGGISLFFHISPDSGAGRFGRKIRPCCDKMKAPRGQDFWPPLRTLPMKLYRAGPMDPTRPILCARARPAGG